MHNIKCKSNDELSIKENKEQLINAWYNFVITTPKNDNNSMYNKDDWHNIYIIFYTKIYIIIQHTYTMK